MLGNRKFLKRGVLWKAGGGGSGGVDGQEWKPVIQVRADGTLNQGDSMDMAGMVGLWVDIEGRIG